MSKLVFDLRYWHSDIKTNSPYSGIIDLSKGWDQEYETFIKNLMMEHPKTRLLDKLLIKITYGDYIGNGKYEKEVEELFSKAYLIFEDEEEYLEEILKIENENPGKIIGKNTCRTEQDVYFYHNLGIRNMYIESPLINDINLLKKLKEDYSVNFIFKANEFKTYGDTITTNWLRPEGIKLYDGIIQFFEIIADDEVNIDAPLRAYHNGVWRGQLREVLVGFGETDESFRDIYNFFPYEIDEFLSICKGDILSTIKLQRQLKSVGSYQRDSYN